MIKEVQKVFEDNGAKVILLDSPYVNEEFNVSSHRMEKDWKADLIKSIKYFNVKETYLYQADFMDWGNPATEENGRLVIRMYPAISIY